MPEPETKALRWYMTPSYSNRRSVPTSWHCFELEPGDERNRRDYVDRRTLCGRTLKFIWGGSMVDSRPDPINFDDWYMRDRWKQVCSKCRTASEARRAAA